MARIVFVMMVCVTLATYASTLPNQQHEMAYDGYKVFRVKAETTDQLRYLRKLSEADSSVGFAKIDFWSEPRSLNSWADFMVPPQLEKDLKTVLHLKNITTQTLIDDVGRMIEVQKEDQVDSLFYLYQNDTIYFQRYHPLSNIHQLMDDLVRSNPEVSSSETIGRSTEGRAMKIIKIGYPSANSIKPVVWIDAGIHAREWIAPATATFIMNKLIKSKNDQDINQLLKTFDFHILPSANPDGYEYSRLFDRFWRKTRSRNSNNSFLGFFCIGVDPNRNYGFQWRKAGSSSNPCSNTYHGPHPFSEPETKAISEHVLQNKNRIKFAFVFTIDTHTLVREWYVVWAEKYKAHGLLSDRGWTRELPRDYADMVRVAEIGSRALKMRYGTEYRYGSSSVILYSAAGGSDDWAHGAAGIKYSFTIELRDQGTYGFLLPQRYIQPTGEETFDALVAMLNEIKKEI